MHRGTALQLLDAFDGLVEELVVDRGRQHVAVLVEAFVAQVEVIVVSVLQLFVTADLGRTVGFLVKEGGHLDERGACHGARQRHAQVVLVVDGVFQVHRREEVVLVQVAAALVLLVAFDGIFHPLLGHFVAQAHVDEQRAERIEVGLDVARIDVHAGTVGVVGLHLAFDDDVAVLHVLLVEEAVGVVDVVDGGVELVDVVVEAGAHVVAVLVLVGHAHLDKVLFGPVVLQVDIPYPLFFVQVAVVAHGFLAVQLEELQVACIVLGEHHLAAVGLFTARLAIGAGPVQLPLGAELMMSVQLVVLQGVDVGDVVAAPQVVPFGIHTRAALVGVAGIAGIEEGIADAVVLAQGVAYGGQGSHLQRGGIFVVREVVLHVAGSLQGLVEGVVQLLCLVAEAE